MTDTQPATKRTTRTASQTFSAAERAAMRERAKELKAAQSKADDARDCLAKIAEMQGADRTMAERLHALITATAPELAPKTWYGMPAYAKDGQIVCFFKSALKYNQRYATLGFSDKAHLDEGTMWPTDFALTELTDADESRISSEQCAEDRAPRSPYRSTGPCAAPRHRILCEPVRSHARRIGTATCGCHAGGLRSSYAR